MTRKTKQTLFVLLVTLATLAFFLSDVSRLLSLDTLQQRRPELGALFVEHPFVFPLAFFLIYTVIAAMSFPGAVVMNLAAGVFFGGPLGVVLVSLASALGGALTFLASRTLFREEFYDRLGPKMRRWSHFFRRDGFYLLFALRLIPVFPYFIVNFLMGITPMRLRTFLLVTLLGMLPGTVLYVYAGHKLTNLADVRDVFTWELVLLFAFLGMLPYSTKKLLEWGWRRHSRRALPIEGEGHGA